MLINDFEDIFSGQKAQDVLYEIYKLFAGLKDFSFSDQIQRASVSLSNTIAEGCERKSNNECKYFIYILLNDLVGNFVLGLFWVKDFDREMEFYSKKYIQKQKK